MSDSGEDGDGWNGAKYVELAVVLTSVVLVAGLLGFVLWQAGGGPGSPDPVAAIESVETVEDRQRVSVKLTNRGEAGLERVQVAVRCGGRERVLEFSQVPGSAERTGTVVCPSGTEPRASVETWVAA